MTNEEIEKIIQAIELDNSKEEVLLGYFSDHDHNYIKANKSGLELYAVELLKAAQEIDIRHFENGKPETFGVNPSWIKNQDHNPLSFIELTPKNRSEITLDDSNYKETWKDNLFKIGCVILILFGIFLLLTGLGTALSWF